MFKLCASRKISSLLATVAAAVLAGCPPIEEAGPVGPELVVLGTRVSIAPSTGALPAQTCDEAVTNVRWILSIPETAATPFVLQPDTVFFFPGGMGEEGDMPSPGVCIFRKERNVADATFEVEARSNA